MKYRKAESVLPQELLEQIQQYIQGEYIYIPNKKGMKKSMGRKNRGKTLYCREEYRD